jgi:hypothetical protein
MPHADWQNLKRRAPGAALGLATTRLELGRARFLAVTARVEKAEPAGKENE